MDEPTAALTGEETAMLLWRMALLSRLSCLLRSLLLASLTMLFALLLMRLHPYPGILGLLSAIPRAMSELAAVVAVIWEETCALSSNGVALLRVLRWSSSTSPLWRSR